jgi:hypothetical protein
MRSQSTFKKDRIINDGQRIISLRRRFVLWIKESNLIFYYIKIFIEKESKLGIKFSIKRVPYTQWKRLTLKRPKRSNSNKKKENIFDKIFNLC